MQKTDLGALEWTLHVSHYMSIGIFSDAQGQLAPQSELISSQRLNHVKILWFSLLPEKMEKIPSKIKALEWC